MSLCIRFFAQTNFFWKKIILTDKFFEMEKNIFLKQRFFKNNFSNKKFRDEFFSLLRPIPSTKCFPMKFGKNPLCKLMCCMLSFY